MELHIKEFEYQNIIKQQFYRQLVVLSLYVLLLVFALESILYGFDCGCYGHYQFKFQKKEKNIRI